MRRNSSSRCYSSARSVHSLHRPYENAEPAGIRPIAKRFSMAGCRLSEIDMIRIRWSPDLFFEMGQCIQIFLRKLEIKNIRILPESAPE